MDGELGLVVAARISPNGQFVGIVDDLAPNVKIVGPAGSVIETMHFDHDTAAAYTPPVLAISNQQLLILRQLPHWAELFDLTGHSVASPLPIDFTPVAAAAVSDSVWLAYGPSLRTDTNGDTAWIHCLYWAHTGAPHWRSLFSGPAPSRDVAPLSGSILLSERRDHVLIAYGDALLPATEVQCGGSPSDARAYKLASVTDTVIATSFNHTAGPSWPSDRSTGEAMTIVRILAGATKGELHVPGQYQVLDQRAGIGALVAIKSPLPALVTIGAGAIGAALAGAK